MPDAKLTALTELTSLTGDEVFYVVDDDVVTPLSRRITVENLASGLAGRTEFSTVYAKLGDWTALGNLGATETITGVTDSFVRSEGTLDMACTITITSSANQTIELQLTQDATGRRGVTWATSTVWHTVSGTAPVLTDRLAGAVDRFFFENIGGTLHGYWLTETLIVPRQFGVSALWYPAVPAAAATAALTFGFPYFLPFVVTERMTLEAVGVYVSTLAASSTIVAAVYNDDDGGLPGTRLLDVNSGAPWSGAASSTFVSTTALSTVLEPGMYWMGYLALTASPTVAATSGHILGSPTIGTPTGSAANLRETTGGRTSLPADVSAYVFVNAANAPLFWLRRS